MGERASHPAIWFQVCTLAGIALWEGFTPQISVGSTDGHNIIVDHNEFSHNANHCSHFLADNQCIITSKC